MTNDADSGGYGTPHFDKAQLCKGASLFLLGAVEIDTFPGHLRAVAIPFPPVLAHNFLTLCRFLTLYWSKIDTEPHFEKRRERARWRLPSR